MGLAELKNKIIQDAKTEAQKIFAAEEKKTAAIIKAAEEKAKEQKGEILKQAERKADEKYKNIIIPEKQKGKSALLSKKRELLDQAFSKALEALIQAPEELLDGLIKQIPKFEQISIVPAAGQEEKIKAALAKAALSHPLENASSKFKGGFMIKSGKIEYDFSFETMVKQQRDDIEPEVIKLLFEESE